MDTYQSYPHSHSRQVYNRQQYRPFPPTTHVTKGSSRAGPYGTNRWQYFKRPLRATNGNEDDQMQSVDGPQNYQQHERHEANQRERYYEAEIEDLEPDTKEVGTQSMYRESEAQTDPYKPDVFVPDGEYPEVLALAELDCKPGFPIGDEQLKEIDRIRRRRHVEATLPMGIDKKSFEKRVAMLKDLEMQEWKERGDKIKKEQAQRLKKIEDRLKLREQRRENFNKAKIRRIKEQCSEQLNKDLNKISYCRQKILRKVQMKYENPENELKKRDIIMEQTYYAPPLEREGRITHDQAIAYEIRPALLTDPKGVEDVDDHQARKHYKLPTLPRHEDLFNIDKIISTNSKKPKKCKRRITNAQRKKAKIAKDVEFARKIQELSKKEKTDEPTNLLDMYRATPRVQRPSTPILEYDDEEEDLENAVITIQKLMRGRQAQNDFSIGKDRALELIKELQEVEKVVRRELDLKNKNPDLVKKTQQKLEDKLLDDVIDNVQGEVISKAMDYLAKQLIRNREMEQIERIRAKAEMERRVRESQELGRRQKEEELRSREEAQFNNIESTADETISTYLSEIFQSTATKLAHKQALETVQDILQKESNKYDTLREESDDKPNSDEAEIKSLLKQFLIPQVKRSTLRERLERDQKKYIKAVHESVTEDLVKDVLEGCE